MQNVTDPRTKWIDRQLRHDDDNIPIPTEILWRHAVGRGHSRGGAESARPENDGQRKLWLWKMAKCKTGKRQTDFLANFG